MDKFQIKMALAGICFGIYPLLLRNSRLPGNVAATLFCFIVWICTFPFAIKELGALSITNWPMITGAGILSAIGMLLMTGVLSAEKNPEKVGLLIILMIVTQTVITALYQAAMDRSLSLTRCAGFALAVGAIVLLNKK